MLTKQRADRNRTLDLTAAEMDQYQTRLLHLDSAACLPEILDRTICQDLFEAVAHLPTGFVDLLFVDPPYNIDKVFNGQRFNATSMERYMSWIDEWLSEVRRLLKHTASIYICCDWRSSPAVQMVAQRYFTLRNRITWEREKGRGAQRNWKNCLEDIWFCTVSDEYTFNVDAVKLKRRVIAPYTTDGKPKGWDRTVAGDYRLTHPSNLWTDLTVPFWSMRENTDHPTQKPEKLVAKVVLASSNPDDIVFDPFLGCGTTSVVAKKLGRHFVGIEIDKNYCCLAEKRLNAAESDASIQGYDNGVFWERNTLGEQKRKRSNVGRSNTSSKQNQISLFGGGQLET